MPIRLLATVITISCLRYRALVSLLASERDTLSRSSMGNAIRIYIYIYICISYRPVSRSIVDI